MKTVKNSISKAIKDIYLFIPLLLGTMLLISLISLIPDSFYSHIFNGSFIDVLTGSIAGSVLAGNPMTSYILGGELFNQGVSLIAVTAFLVSWVTVGTIQFPVESIILGKKFAISRNILSFIFSIIVAIITVTLYNLF